MRTVILGTGGHARAVAHLLTKVREEPIVMTAELFTGLRPGERGVIVGIGCSDMAMRERLFLWHAAVTWAYGSPSGCPVGPGTVVFNGVHVGASVVVGRNVVVYPGCVIEHDSRIQDHAWLSPSVTLCGNVTVKPRAFLGAGAIILPGVTIGEGARIGAGAVIHDDVGDGVTVYGPRHREAIP